MQATDRCFFCTSQSGVENKLLEYGLDHGPPESMTLPVCERCWHRISAGAWELKKEGDLIRLRDAISGETICRRVTALAGFSKDDYETSLQNLQRGYEYVVRVIEVLPWEELKRLFNFMGVVGEYAWKIRAFCVAEGYERIAGTQAERIQQVGDLFGIRRSQVYYYLKIASTFSKERVLASKLGERFFIKAASSSNPERWTCTPSSRKARTPIFPTLILLGKYGKKRAYFLQKFQGGARTFKLTTLI
jgi:hypothetical protein